MSRSQSRQNGQSRGQSRQNGAETERDRYQSVLDFVDPEHLNFVSPLVQRYTKYKHDKPGNDPMSFNFSDYKKCKTWRELWMYLAKSLRVKNLHFYQLLLCCTTPKLYFFSDPNFWLKITSHFCNLLGNLFIDQASNSTVISTSFKTFVHVYLTDKIYKILIFLSNTLAIKYFEIISMYSL